MKVRVILDAEKEAFPELEDRSNVKKAELTAITALPGGMEGGNTSVGFIGKTAGGEVVFMETSLRVFQAAAAGFTGRYGDTTGDAAWGAGFGDAFVGWTGGKPSDR